MMRWTVFPAVTVACILAVLGCSGGGEGPVTPSCGLETSVESPSGSSQTHLWGFYDVYIGPETETVEAVVNREAMFSANVVTFLNTNPAGLSFHINKVNKVSGYTDINIDVSITHPFPGMSAYNGYDVRGIFMGHGSLTMQYNTDLKYARWNVDQQMLPDPTDPIGGDFGEPDGYTRWYNAREFKTPGLFGYTKGIYATPGYSPTASLCPYKYYADSLTETDYLWPWLQQHAGLRGVFSAGATNCRRYHLRFPDTKGIVYSYAVVANWAGEATHPANATEAICCDVDVTDDVWYLDETYNGGELILDISIYDWNSHSLSAGVMDDYDIFIESTVLSNVHEFTNAEMTPTGSGNHYYTYHCELTANKVESVERNEFWVIVEYPECFYTNDMGIPNLAGWDYLAAFFRYDLEVSPVPINEEPVCDLVVDPSTPTPSEDFLPAAMRFDATGSYDPDPKDTLYFEWDFDGDGNYDEDPDDAYLGDPDYPLHLYYSDYAGDVLVRVTDHNTGEDVCSVPVDVTTHQSKNIELRTGFEARDIAVDHTNGDLLVIFEDNAVWRYPRTGFYQTGSQFIETRWGSYYIDPHMLDMAHNQYTMVAGVLWSYNSSTIYNPSGTYVSTPFWLTWQSTSCDAVAMGPNGSYDDDLCFVHGYIQTGVKHNILRRHISSGYTSWAQHDYSFTEIQYGGYDKIYFDWVVGCESDLDGDYVWFLEDADYYASRWELTASPYDLVYDGCYFGTGVQTNDDGGFYEPKDITRDSDNRLFCLDRLSSGDARVKVWTVDGGTATSVGGFDDTNALGDTSCLSGSPLKIEGSDYDAYIVVLHGDTDPYLVSVFSPPEMPGFEP